MALAFYLIPEPNPIHFFRVKGKIFFQARLISSSLTDQVSQHSRKGIKEKQGECKGKPVKTFIKPLPPSQTQLLCFSSCFCRYPSSFFVPSSSKLFDLFNQKHKLVSSVLVKDINLILILKSSTALNFCTSNFFFDEYKEIGEQWEKFFKLYFCSDLFYFLLEKTCLLVTEAVET